MDLAGLDFPNIEGILRLSRAIQDPIYRSFILKEVVEELVEKSKIDDALTIASAIPDSNEQIAAYEFLCISLKESELERTC